MHPMANTEFTLSKENAELILKPLKTEVMLPRDAALNIVRKLMNEAKENAESMENKLYHDQTDMIDVFLVTAAGSDKSMGSPRSSGSKAWIFVLENPSDLDILLFTIIFFCVKQTLL